jgi:hypothetical protein
MGNYLTSPPLNGNSFALWETKTFGRFGQKNCGEKGIEGEDCGRKKCGVKHCTG